MRALWDAHDMGLVFDTGRCLTGAGWLDIPEGIQLLQFA